MEFAVVCAKKTCKKQFTHDQPNVPCWLCDSVVHAKCAGFSGLVSDAIAKRNGLHYSCEACRAVEKDMVAFMRQTRSGFKELTVGFKNQYDRLLAMEAQFSGLKLLNESPRRKKVTPRDLQVPTVTLPCAAEKLTPTTPSVQRLISFATPRATTAAGDADSVAEFIASENVQPSTSAASVSVVSASSLVVPSIPIPPVNRRSGRKYTLLHQILAGAFGGERV